MEVARGYLARHGQGLATYLAFERALMRHWIARGGTGLDFCRRLAPAFRRRYGLLLLGESGRDPGAE